MRACVCVCVNKGNILVLWDLEIYFTRNISTCARHTSRQCVVPHHPWCTVVHVRLSIHAVDELSTDLSTNVDNSSRGALPFTPVIKGAPRGVSTLLKISDIPTALVEKMCVRRMGYEGFFSWRTFICNDQQYLDVSY